MEGIRVEKISVFYLFSQHFLSFFKNYPNTQQKNASQPIDGKEAGLIYKNIVIRTGNNVVSPSFLKSFVYIR